MDRCVFVKARVRLRRGGGREGGRGEGRRGRTVGMERESIGGREGGREEGREVCLYEGTREKEWPEQGGGKEGGREGGRARRLVVCTCVCVCFRVYV